MSYRRPLALAWSFWAQAGIGLVLAGQVALAGVAGVSVWAVGLDAWLVLRNALVPGGLAAAGVAYLHVSLSPTSCSPLPAGRRAARRRAHYEEQQRRTYDVPEPELRPDRPGAADEDGARMSELNYRRALEMSTFAAVRSVVLDGSAPAVLSRLAVSGDITTGHLRVTRSATSACDVIRAPSGWAAAHHQRERYAHLFGHIGSISHRG